MKILLIDPEANDLDWAMRSQEVGHSVRVWNEPGCHAGEGIVPKMKEWQSSMKWADLICISSNNVLQKELRPFFEAGLPIVGANEEGARLELDREWGQKVLADNGVATIPFEVFDNYDKAIKFVESTKAVYVCKPWGGESDKSLSFVSSRPEDMIFKLQRWKDEGLKGKFMLQERVEGVEMGVSGWFGPGGWCSWLEEDFEEKRLMNEELGPNCGEQGTTLRFVKRSLLFDKVLKPLTEHLHSIDYVGNINVNTVVDTLGKPWPLELTCYDDQTEVLTRSGWKFFKDVRVGEDIATLNPALDELEYHPAISVIEKPYVGSMIHFSGESHAPDICVTPNHQMWVRDRTTETFRFVRAADVYGRTMQIQRSVSVWTGEDRPTFYLPGRVEQHYLGRHNKVFQLERPAIEIPMECWLRFLGLYISEGSLGNHRQSVNIAQSQQNHDKILPLLQGFPIPFRIEASGSLSFNNKQLAEYLDCLHLGLSYEKFIPEEFKALSPKYLAALLEGLIAGDGTTHIRSGQRSYFSTSKKLADDVQELMLKLGYLGRIVCDKVAGSAMEIGGKSYTRNHDLYRVYERREKTFGWVDRRTARLVPYSGSVHCLNVPPHHLLYVRRNGNPSWCGNCRWGWPAFAIFQALHKGDPALWLRDLVRGKDSLEMSTEVAVGVVLTHGDYPNSKLTERNWSGFPLRGVSEGNFNDLHFVDVMFGKAPVKLGESFPDKNTYVTSEDAILVVTGIGKAVQEAQQKAYATAEQIDIPGDIGYRTDVGSRLKEGLPLLQEHGFAREMEY